MSQYHSLEIAEVRPETRDAVTITLAVPELLRAIFHFTHGQHLNVRAHIAGEEIRRSYSICSAAQDQLLRILVKRQPGGIFSNWAQESLHRGDRLEVMPPAGLFHLPLDASRAGRYLAIAAGSGITPVLSVIKTTLLAEPRSEFTLFYGNRASSSILFREELADLKDVFLTRFTLVHVMSREQQDLDLLNGRLSRDKVEALLALWGPLAAFDAIFLCGPQQMNDDLSRALQDWGFPKPHIKVELFANSQQRSGPRPILAPAAAEVCQATLILDGHHHQFPVLRRQETILDAGLRAGLDLRFSCKSGVCATCRAKLTQGEVDMDGNFALEDYEIARGYILTCQSYPVTPTVIVDFDQD